MNRTSSCAWPILLRGRKVFRLTEPQGRIGHAELQIRGSRRMLADEHPDFPRPGIGRRLKRMGPRTVPWEAARL